MDQDYCRIDDSGIAIRENCRAKEGSKPPRKRS